MQTGQRDAARVFIDGRARELSTSVPTLGAHPSSRAPRRARSVASALSVCSSFPSFAF